MEIRLEKLKIRNFKGIDAFDFEPQGKTAYILGDNGTGKSTVYDAYCWLLFGCDSRENAAFDIEPRDEQGNVIDPEAVTDVSAVLSADGKEIRLRKRNLQKWVHVRGRTELTYQGNTNEYEYNGVPCTMRDYQDRINALCPAELLKILSSVFRFPSMAWQDQRAALFDLIGTKDDITLMGEQGGKYDELIGMMQKTDSSLDEIGDMIRRDLKTAVKAQNSLPAAIEENRRYLSSESKTPDRGALDADMEALKASLDRLNEKRAAEMASAEIVKLTADRRTAEAEIAALRRENDAYIREQRSLFDIAHDIARLRRDVHYAEDRGKKASERMSAAAKRKERLKIRIEDMRAQYAELYAEKYSGEDTCPRCGRKYDAVMIEKAREHFEAEKKERLNALAAEGKILSSAYREAEAEWSESQAEIEAASGLAAKAKERLDNCGEFVPEDMSGYAERLSEQEAKRDALIEREKFETDCREKIIADIDRDINEKRGRISEILRALGDMDRVETVKERIRQLESELKEKSGLAAHYEKLLALIEEYTLFKARAAEDSVNSLFEKVKFKLFDVQKNGGLRFCCEATVDGIGFNKSLNTSARINAGLDIINGFSRKIGVATPIFVDNAESITELMRTNGQLICLKVQAGQTEMRCGEK